MKRAYLAVLSAPLAIAAMALPAPVMAAANVTITAVAPSPAYAPLHAFDAADYSAEYQRRYRRGDTYRGRDGYGYNDDDDYSRRDYRDDRRDYRQDRRDVRRDYRQDRRDYRRDQALSRDSRVWRDRKDGRYYCQRDDGTTGLLIGGAVGGLIGNEVAGRGDKLLGTVLGAAGGALLGKHIDRSNYRCR